MDPAMHGLFQEYEPDRLPPDHRPGKRDRRCGGDHGNRSCGLGKRIPCAGRYPIRCSPSCSSPPAPPGSSVSTLGGGPGGNGSETAEQALRGGKTRWSTGSSLSKPPLRHRLRRQGKSSRPILLPQAGQRKSAALCLSPPALPSRPGWPLKMAGE